MIVLTSMGWVRVHGTRPTTVVSQLRDWSALSTASNASKYEVDLSCTEGGLCDQVINWLDAHIVVLHASLKLLLVLRALKAMHGFRRRVTKMKLSDAKILLSR